MASANLVFLREAIASNTLNPQQQADLLTALDAILPIFPTPDETSSSNESESIARQWVSALYAIQAGGGPPIPPPVSGVTAVTASPPLASTGGTTPNLALTGAVDIAHGGTGQTTQQAAINALLPSQTGEAGNVLATDGTNAEWVSPENVYPPARPLSLDVVQSLTGPNTGTPIPGMSETFTATSTEAIAVLSGSFVVSGGPSKAIFSFDFPGALAGVIAPGSATLGNGDGNLVARAHLTGMIIGNTYQLVCVWAVDAGTITCDPAQDDQGLLLTIEDFKP